MVCIIVGPILQLKSRTIPGKNGRPGVVPMVQKKWLHRFGLALIVLGVISTVFGLIVE